MTKGVGPSLLLRPTALGRCPHQKLISIICNFEWGLPISLSKDSSGLFLFVVVVVCIGKKVRSWPFKKAFTFFPHPTGHDGHIQSLLGPPLPRRSFSKSWKTTLWPQTKCGAKTAWLLGSSSVPLTAAQPVEASGIRTILSSGPGKNVLCCFCGKRKKL